MILNDQLGKECGIELRTDSPLIAGLQVRDVGPVDIECLRKLCRLPASCFTDDAQRISVDLNIGAFIRHIEEDSHP